MTPEHLEILEERFSSYADRFIRNSSQPAPLILKKEHTARVNEEIESLCISIIEDGDSSFLKKMRSENGSTDLFIPDTESVLIAKVIALFHDLGRFRQFEEYRTFLDRKSANHAGLSIVEIARNNILDICSKREQSIIKKAIAVHNGASIPESEDNETQFFMKLIRDADKLDIWRVVIKNYMTPDPDNEETVNLGFADNGGCTESSLNSILAQTFVKLDSIKELNDLKLMQISWVFDLNFRQSVERVKVRGYVDRLSSLLSIPEDHGRLGAALHAVNEYMIKNSVI